MSAGISLPFFVETSVNNMNKGQNQVPPINKRRTSPQNIALISLPKKGIFSLPEERWNLSNKPFINIALTWQVCDRYTKAASTSEAQCKSH